MTREGFLSSPSGINYTDTISPLGRLNTKPPHNPEKVPLPYSIHHMQPSQTLPPKITSPKSEISTPPTKTLLPVKTLQIWMEIWNHTLPLIPIWSPKINNKKRPERGQLNPFRTFLYEMVPPVYLSKSLKSTRTLHTGPLPSSEGPTP